YIHRWRLEPKEEERERYFSGELVEPQKPIVFYVDSSFPDKWREVIKLGIEDWNTAFEAAGFKNAIQARDYPKDNPDFDPDDIRYSCVKYATTTTANAMGPSFTDPRSGEILTADVIWYHNIVSLLHNWRFCQTAATDSSVRKTVFDDETMCESMRYVISHEIGHTLGLMHNMGASYAFPVDSLRSATFTQKYGTTPSIMDYARNNYIAQPGDLERGVKMTPPILGVYDIYAIAWGYHLIPGANSPAEEEATLTRWIEEKADDPMYEFGAQQIMGTIDPTDQTEDLGNDHMRAGDYGISNLKIIMDNLEAWSGEQGKPYESLADVYDQLIKQYTRYIGHVMTYIGGVVYKDARQGKENMSRTYLDKDTQKRAVAWLLHQARTYNQWLTPSSLMLKFDRPLNSNDKLRRSIVASLLNSSAFYRIEEGGLVDKQKNYTLEGYLDDVISGIFQLSYQGKALDSNEQELQSTALDILIKYSGLSTNSTKKTTEADKSLADYASVTHLRDNLELPCNDETAFLRINMGQQSISNTRIAPLTYAYLKKIESLYKQQRTQTNDKSTRDFYDYQLLQLKKLFESSTL
ncbi:MAG: zinc-dependent metalloprotease, partial [Porphyromonadaceae bacterium]|nr:zinc-dependent metalloprotease [Porphyromonadaceae bacterium]